MVFSSPIFLFWFLPVTLVVYYLSVRAVRNYILLINSLVFYGWGEAELLGIMLGSVAINYLFGLWVGKASGISRKGGVVLSVLANLGLLVYYKYSNFFADNYNVVAGWMHVQPWVWEKVVLPLGISFFTFQGMSYVLDVYRKDTEVQTNPFSLALYISFFPQLIAGPIVRYHDVALQIQERQETRELFVSGLIRFIIGLSKKVLIANQVAKVAEMAFSTPIQQLGVDVAWIGLLAVSVQIYFDFSGYSDMAIGLGRMFGFRFSENFIFPLSSVSMREFWTRWHISLSSWFRDYVFIPLGGSKKGFWRTQLNLWIIFLLMGFWHGAEWIFIGFGIWHGSFIVLERFGFENFIRKLPRVFGNMYVWMIYMCGNIIFSSSGLQHAWLYTTRLFTTQVDGGYSDIWVYISPLFWTVLIIGLLLNYPVFAWIKKRLSAISFSTHPAALTLQYFGALVLLLLCMSQLANATYNPFIYFRF